MSPELPESIRKSLAQKPGVTTHPSADLLTAFAERALTAGENELVANHLASCPECREVLFLASNADEQLAAEAKGQPNAAWKPRPRWMARLASIVFAASGLVIVAGIFLRIYLEHEDSVFKAARVANVKSQPVTPPQSTPQEVPVAPESATLNSRASTTQNIQKPMDEVKSAPEVSAAAPHESSETVVAKAAPPGEAKPSEAPSAPKTQSMNQPPGAVTGRPLDSTTAATTPTQNAFRAHAENSLAQSAASSDSHRAALLFMPSAPANSNWRITPEGRLEHLSQAGWTGVLTDKPAKFRVVYQAANGIWAGGTAGELFHSGDGGEHWSEVALPVPANQESDGIAAIHFADLQHGIVLTQTKARYITSDGGQSWQRE